MVAGSMWLPHDHLTTFNFIFSSKCDRYLLICCTCEYFWCEFTVMYLPLGLSDVLYFKCPSIFGTLEMSRRDRVRYVPSKNLESSYYLNHFSDFSGKYGKQIWQPQVCTLRPYNKDHSSFCPLLRVQTWTISN